MPSWNVPNKYEPPINDTNAAAFLWKDDGV
jgi:hypothetical protein